MDCSLSGSTIHGIFQARILEWVDISFSRRSSQPRDWTQVSRIVGRRFTIDLPKTKCPILSPFQPCHSLWRHCQNSKRCFPRHGKHRMCWWPLESPCSTEGIQNLALRRGFGVCAVPPHPLLIPLISLKSRHSQKNSTVLKALAENFKTSENWLLSLETRSPALGKEIT